MTEPLKAAEPSEYEDLLRRWEQEKAHRAEWMPNDHDALIVLFDAWLRLKELGWREAIYCPKDGSVFEVIEAGSTGIHDCHYEGEWPTGSWWVHSQGDLSPSRPILFRLKSGPTSLENR